MKCEKTIQPIKTTNFVDLLRLNHPPQLKKNNMQEITR